MPKRRERKVLIRVVFLVGLRMLCCAPRIFLTPALWTAVYCCLLMYSCRAGNRSYKLYLPRHRERASDFKQWGPQQALHADYIFSGIPATSLGLLEKRGKSLVYMLGTSCAGPPAAMCSRVAKEQKLGLAKSQLSRDLRPPLSSVFFNLSRRGDAP